MEKANIAKLLAPFLSGGNDLSPAQLEYISIYIDTLLRWNARINLTAVRKPEEIVTRHFGESLFAARQLFPRDEVLAKQKPLTPSPPQVRVIDIGSGAGFPGVPIRIWAPQVRLTLIESNQRKATFLREVIRHLALTGVEVFTGRADVFREGQADVVTLRAVERFKSILPVAERLVALSGRLAVLVGTAQIRAIREILPEFDWGDAVRMPMSENRALIIGSKNQDD